MTDKISICLKCGTDCECPKWYETEIRKLATESEQLRKERDDAISNYETILNLYNKILGSAENGNA